MASGDMKVRLLLDGKEFELTLQRAQNKTKNFAKDGKKAGDDFAAAFKKVTAAIATIKTAEAAFDSVINSSQVLGDKFRANVEGMKTVVDNFIYSIANADFSPFADGLAAMFDKAKKAAAASDQFGNTQMATSYVMATQGSAYREAMANARNKSLSNEERQQWLDIAKKEAEAIAEAQKTLERDALEALRQGLSAQSGLAGGIITEKAIIEALTLDARYNNSQQRAEIDAAYQQLMAANEARVKAVVEQYTKSTTNLGSSLTGGTSYTTTYLEGYDEAMAAAKEANAQALKDSADLIVKYNLLFRNTDEALNAAYATAQAAVGARNQLAEIATSTNEVGNSLSTEMAKSAEAAAKLRAEMQKLKEIRTVGNLAGISYTDTSLKLPGSIAMLDENPAQRAYNYWQGVKLDEIEAQSQQLKDMNDVVGMLGDSFAQLGGSIGGSAGSMLEFAGSISDAVQAILPFISYLQAEILLHSQEADAATRAAGAKALSAYAGIPGAGIALGLGALATVVAAVQSIPKVSDVPKFAEGGIVNRATLGIFGEAGPEAVMPLDKLDQYIQPRELRVTGAIKASGKDLVVVLDNYNKVRKVK